MNYEWPHDPKSQVKNFMEHVLPQYQARDEDNQFAFTIPNLGYKFVEDLVEHYFDDKEFVDSAQGIFGNPSKDNVYYIDSAQSICNICTSKWISSSPDILAIDGRGWKFNCIFVDSKALLQIQVKRFHWRSLE